MSFFKKAMANFLGIGNTKVDTIITTSSIPNGGTVEGNIIIKGGSIEQKISKINLEVKASYDKEVDEVKHEVYSVLQSFEVPVNKVVKPGETINQSFKFKITPNTPISIPRHRVLISTNLDIEGGIDSGDGDTINIYANRYMQSALDAIKDMGFVIREVENIKASYIYGNLPFVQEFEFIPISAEFRGKLDELEVIFIHKQNDVDIFLQVDRKARGLGGLFAEKLSLDETNIKITLSYEELLNKDSVKEVLYSTISKYTY